MRELSLLLDGQWIETIAMTVFALTWKSAEVVSSVLILRQKQDAAKYADRVALISFWLMIISAIVGLVKLLKLF
ncbi:hypothetical protein Barb6_03349 [Bacteroidales bacterium Barb6]|nr:hypothetical protein Barb6_03349 [Bacteroidales bacterium Barb6]